MLGSSLPLEDDFRQRDIMYDLRAKFRLLLLNQQVFVGAISWCRPRRYHLRFRHHGIASPVDWNLVELNDNFGANMLGCIDR